MSDVKVGSIHYDLTIKKDKFDKSVDEVNGKLSDMGGRLVSFGKQVAVAGALAGGAFSLNAIKAASDFNETINKIDVAFKEQSDSVKKWANTSLKSMGLAKGSALDAAALFGDMSTSMGLTTEEAASMSTNLVQLGADMASFKNVSFDRAQTALSAVYTGETEALKSLGIVMTETNLEAFAQSKGITQNIQDMTQAEKVNLRYAFVMESTKNAQGDFTRTADGTANQIRVTTEKFKEISAEIGQKFLPVANFALDFTQDLMDAFADLAKNEKLLSWLGSVKDGFTGVKDVVELLITGDFKGGLFGLAEDSTFVTFLFGIRDAVSSVYTGFLNLTSYITNMVRPMLSVLIMGLTPVFNSLKTLGEMLWQQLWPALKSIWEALKRLWEALNPALTEALKIVGALIAGTLIVMVLQFINALKWVVNAIEAVIKVTEWLINWWIKLINFMVEAGKGAWRLGGDIIRALSDIPNKVGGIITSVIQWFKDLPGNITSALSGVGDAISAPFKAAFNKIAEFWNSTAGQLSFTVPDWVPGLGNKGWDMPDIPMLAQGGIVTKPTLAMIGEGGEPEAVVPLSKMAQMGTNIYGNVTIGDKTTADYFFERLSRDQDLLGMGLAGGSYGSY